MPTSVRKLGLFAIIWNKAKAVSELERNIETARRYLQRFEKCAVLNQIDGEARTALSGETFANHSPIDDGYLCDVVRSGDADVDAAAKAAKRAFPTWRDLAATERKQRLHAIADRIVERAEEIALCECVDSGQALRFMSKAALRGAENFRFFADRAPSARDGQMLPSPTLMNVTTRVPIGPVGVITPWNTPFMLSTWKIAPALAAGCTVVHKPAELSPITARLLVEIAEEAGLPPGVWNVVNGMGEEAGAALTRHPDIKAIAFVGESATGSTIMHQGAPTLKRVHFELGGKNPVIVFDDADLDRALDAADLHDLFAERRTLHLVVAPVAAPFNQGCIRGEAGGPCQQDTRRSSARSNDRGRPAHSSGSPRQGEQPAISTLRPRKVRPSQPAAK